MIDRDRVREALTGPISSIRTPFKKDGGVDLDGLRNTLDFNIEAGSKTMLLTAGDSHYVALSDQEIAEVSRVVIEHTARRAMVVTADRFFHTKQAVAFAKYVAEIGSDVHMVLPPDWGASCTSETLCGHYAQVAENMPVMVVTGIFSPKGEDFGLRTLELVKEASRFEIDYGVLEQYLGFFAGCDVLVADPGAEIDLLAMMGRFDLIRDYIGFLRSRFNTVITSVHHAGVTLPLLEQENIPVDGYLTTVNQPGVFMFPSRDHAIDAIKNASKPVIAIKPMAGGRYLGHKAFDFVFNEVGVSASMFGMGTVDQVRETTKAAREVLGVAA
ncbi:MAG: dihydrodipicolinate synthase family protein [Candidatus Latescibacteria bacterium]|nr:dihydrodipicolinate synthase family protein [Candidatus Latescibacterota bacterium]